MVYDFKIIWIWIFIKELCILAIRCGFKIKLIITNKWINKKAGVIIGLHGAYFIIMNNIVFKSSGIVFDIKLFSLISYTIQFNWR